MKKLSDYTLIVEEALANLSFAERRPYSLYAPIEYGLSAGGKRLRPSMLLLSAYAFGGINSMERAIGPSVGIETFHNFTLLHDDVMDNSDTRRGRPTVHAKWDANTAILSGDTMLTLATKMVADVEDKILRRVLDTFNEMALEVYEGQQMDMDFEKSSDVSLEEYTDMIQLKTGALLGASAEIGAIIGGASEKDCEAMREFGNMLGIAFQIQDDWLDTFGDPATFGKPIGGDILNDKKTFLMVMAMHEGKQEVDALKAALALQGETKIKAVTRIYEKMGINEMARKAVASFSSKAMKAIKSTTMDTESKEVFRTLTERLTGRKK